MRPAGVPGRRDLYRGLLSSIGRYFFHEAYTGVYEETVTFDDDHPFVQIIDWVEAGEDVTVRAFHLWGVGGGRGSDWSYHYCKDREIEWDRDSESWVVEESEKYVIDGGPATPPGLPTAPAGFTVKRRVGVGGGSA